VKRISVAVSIIIALVVGLVFITGVVRVCHSQYVDAEDQQISEMSSSLGEEMRDQEDEGKGNMEEMDESMRGNEAPLGVGDY